MMSLFKNRIPKNSVSFSHETYELQFPKAIPDITSEEAEELKIDVTELLQQQQMVQMEMQQLRENEQQLQMQYEAFMRERELFEQQKAEEIRELEQERILLEQEKKKAVYEWGNLLWDQSFQLAEKIVNQAIDARQLEVLPILTGIVQTLPTSFEKLIITVHPDTFEQIEKEKEQTKEYWLLQLVEWKYDFSLQFGEFVLEEEKEFFHFQFLDIFENLRKRREEEKMFEEQLT